MVQYTVITKLDTIMQKLLFIIGSSFCLTALAPNLSFANNEPKINLSLLKKKNKKKKNRNKVDKNTTASGHTNTSSQETKAQKLTSLIKNIAEDAQRQDRFDHELAIKDRETVKMTLEGYERYEENKALITTYTQLQQKFAGRMNIHPQQLTNILLLEEMDKWYGTPYHYGGSSKRGVDCSAFTRAMVEEVFKVHLPRTAREQYGTVEKISRNELEEGDLVFFNTTGGISHVGLYLGNNKFIHAASSRGVSISDLDDRYWAARYVGGGKLF